MTTETSLRFLFWKLHFPQLLWRNDSLDASGALEKAGICWKCDFWTSHFTLRYLHFLTYKLGITCLSYHRECDKGHMRCMCKHRTLKIDKCNIVRLVLCMDIRQQKRCF